MTTFSQEISAGADDGELQAGTWSTGGASPRAGYALAAYSWYHIWNNVTIAKNSTVSAASTSVYGAGVSGSYSVKIGFSDEDNAAMPTSSGDASGRSFTASTTNWTTGFTNGATNTSPDISSSAQNLVDRASWASGNKAMSMGRDNVGSGVAYIQTYHYDSGVGTGLLPTISITYTAPAAGGGTAVYLTTLGVG